MSLATNVSDLATRIATEIKSLRTLVNGNSANLSGLTTTAKTNLVAAINELDAAVTAAAQSGGASINDAAISASTTWSSTKIDSQIDLDVSAAVSGLVNGAPLALDTLSELAAALENAAEDSEITAILTALDNRVRFDAAQVLTDPQKVQARANIGAGTSDLVIGTTGTTAKAGNYAPTAADISNATTIGRALIVAVDAAAGRTAIGAGTSNLTIGTTNTTAKAGDYAPPVAAAGTSGTINLAGDLAGTSPATSTAAVPRVISATTGVAGKVQLATSAEATTGTDTAKAVTPAALKAVADTKAPTTHTHTASQISDSTGIGRSIITAADAPAVLTLIGAASAAGVGDTTTNFVTTFEAGLV